MDAIQSPESRIGDISHEKQDPKRLTTQCAPESVIDPFVYHSGFKTPRSIPADVAHLDAAYTDQNALARTIKKTNPPGGKNYDNHVEILDKLLEKA